MQQEKHTLALPEKSSRQFRNGSSRLLSGELRYSRQLRLVLRALMRGCVLSLALLFATGCPKKEARLVQDEAKIAGKTSKDFPQITANVFKPMDGGIDLSPEEIMGR